MHQVALCTTGDLSGWHDFMYIENFTTRGAKSIDLSTVQFTPELLRCIPRYLALKYRVVPVSASADRLSVAVAETPDLDVMNSLTHLLKCEVEFHPIDEQQLDTFLRQLYSTVQDGSR